MSRARTAKHTAAVVALLQSLPEDQLRDVLAAVPPPPPAKTPGRRGQPCGICGQIYPVHLRLWTDDDHDFEAVPR